MTQDDWNYEFSANLLDMMREFDISIDELANKTGLSKSIIYKYIDGTRTPGVKAIINISYVLDCDIDELVDFDEMID